MVEEKKDVGALEYELRVFRHKPVIDSRRDYLDDFDHCFRFKVPGRAPSIGNGLEFHLEISDGSETSYRVFDSIDAFSFDASHMVTMNRGKLFEIKAPLTIVYACPANEYPITAENR